jgi:superfamily II DNA/RNA helicase
MTYRNNDRGGARRDDRNHRPFNGRNQRRGSQHGGRRGGNPKADVGGFRGTPLEINEDTPFATEFAELGIPSKLAYGLGAQGILEPFPIQAATIGDALAGRDVLGRGRTGSGKTLAFGLPLLSRLMGNKSESTKPRGMILVPTRELAMQVHDALAPLGHLVGLKFSIIIGGAQYSRQIDSLARGADIVVATPGRLEDLIERGACDLSAVEIAILDEADQMADMGFLPIVSDLMALIPAGGQRLLFSATLDRGVDAIVEAHLVDPVEHATDPGTASVTTMDHHVFLTEPRDKFAVVRTIATRKGRCIAFVRTQRAADEVSDELRAIGVQSDALHGGKTQAARNKALSRLKAGEISVLIATDVAARGIHIDDIDLVLNIDLPRDHKDYLHRAGRTARAGANGLVISIGSVKQKRTVKRLMDDAGLEPTYHTVRASDDVVAELAGATDVVTHRPRTDGSEPRRELSDRDDRRERPAREERRDDRPRFDRERPARDERRDDRLRFDRDRPARDDRRDDRPRFDRDDRRDAPRRDDRRDDRPRFDRDRPREDRPRFDREDRRPAARTEFRS